MKLVSPLSEELGKKNKKEVETQMQFNAANDKSLQRMTKKDNETEATLESKFKLQIKKKNVEFSANSIDKQLDNTGSKRRNDITRQQISFKNSAG